MNVIDVVMPAVVDLHVRDAVAVPKNAQCFLNPVSIATIASSKLLNENPKMVKVCPSRIQKA